MPVCIDGRRPPRALVMATRAIGARCADRSRRDLFAVDVPMAILAALVARAEREARAAELDAVRGRSIMALAARNARMRSLEREVGRAMACWIKRRRPESLQRVAGRAIARSRASRGLPRVRVGVTRGTAIESGATPGGHFGRSGRSERGQRCRRRGVVTLRASDRRVFPHEWISRPAVIERRCVRVPPTGRCVASLAIGAEAAGVRILVAANTRGIEAEPTPSGVGSVGLRDNRGGLAIGTVARSAGRYRMFAFEAPSGSGVVEVHRRTAFPAHECEVPARMVGMTGGAPRASLARMQSSVRVDQAANLGVALEARPIHCIALSSVTLETSTVALERLVRRRQRTG